MASGNLERITIEGVPLTPEIINRAKNHYERLVATSANYMLMCDGFYKNIEKQINTNGEFNIKEEELMVLNTAFDNFKYTLTLIQLLRNSEHKHMVEDPKVYELEETLEHHMKKTNQIMKGDYVFDSAPKTPSGQADENNNTDAKHNPARKIREA